MKIPESSGREASFNITGCSNIVTGERSAESSVPLTLSPTSSHIGDGQTALPASLCEDHASPGVPEDGLPLVDTSTCGTRPRAPSLHYHL